tara:strand:+ start:20603 stop:21502 length:900 start_codon:yes stop_codon:yes gene_type:complete
MENPIANMKDAASDLVAPKSDGPFAKFGSNKFVDGTKDFLNSNSLVAKVVFLLLVLIIFIMAIRVMLVVLHKLFGPKPNPILIKGIVNGKKAVTVSQDPKIKGSKPIMRSNNQDGGIEFSYAVWLLIEDDNFHSYRPGVKKHIFHKGSEGINTTDPGYMGMAYPNNSPGLYLDSKENKLIVLMNTYDKVSEKIMVPDIPIHKWISVILRLENRNLDVYVNGTIVARHELKSVPKQNYGNVYANQGGGFSGLMSNLRYFNRALTITEIQQIVSAGPNMSSNSTLSIFPPYLSMRWFLGHQ